MQLKYSIFVNVGKNAKWFNLVLGMLFEDVWLQRSDCTICKKESVKYEVTAEDGNLKNEEEKYADSADGLIVSGEYLNANISMMDFNINTRVVGASQYYDLYNTTIDGILGLGTDESSIVYSLYKQGKISKPIYSIHSLEIDAPSLILDSPDFESLNLTIEESMLFNYRSNLTASFKYDNKSFEEQPVEFSSINSYIIGPREIIQSFYNDLILMYDCFHFEEFLMCNCDKEYPYITFTIGNANITITSESYLMPVISNIAGNILHGIYQTWQVMDTRKTLTLLTIHNSQPRSPNPSTFLSGHH